MDQYTMFLHVQVNKLNQLELDQELVVMLEDIVKYKVLIQILLAV